MRCIGCTLPVNLIVTMRNPFLEETLTVNSDPSLRRSIWISSLITFVAFAVFVGISALIPRPGSRFGLILLGLFLALIPALLWMAFFYRQDRAEPEPKRLVARMFGFGALAAAAIAVPFGAQVTSSTLAQFPNPIVRVVLLTLSVALVQETLKVAMVRYVVLGTDEFDRHPDGIVYGLASGLGFATILTLAYVLRAGGVLPLAGAIRAVDNVLVHGALGAVSGYYIGRVKIDGKKLSWMAMGLGLVTVINGLYQGAQNELASQFAYNPWYDLLAAVILAVIVGSVLFYVFRLALRRASGDLSTVSMQSHARAMDMPWDIAVRYDILLLAAVAIAVLVGLGAGLWARSAVVRYQGDMPVVFQYPARWAQQSGETGLFSVRDLSTLGVFKPTLTVESQKVAEGTALDLFAAQRSAVRSQTLTYYTVLEDNSDLTVSGLPAIRKDYEYSTLTASGPAVVRVTEIYVMSQRQITILRYEAEHGSYDLEIQSFERLLRSLQFTNAE